MFLAKGACRATVGTDSLARQPQLSEARTGSGSCIPPHPREGGVGVGRSGDQNLFWWYSPSIINFNYGLLAVSIAALHTKVATLGQVKPVSTVSAGIDGDNVSSSVSRKL